MAVLWEYVPSLGLTKEPVRSDYLPENPTDYVPPDFWDLKSPTREARFRASGMTAAEFTTLENTLAVRGAVVSLTDSTGTPWVGVFRSLTGEVIPGTNMVTDIELAIQRN